MQTPSKKKSLALLPWWFIPMLCFGFALGVIDIAWQINNPKGNQMTIWTHFNDAVQFKKLREFQ
jgi:hypothetical protein